MKNLNDVTFITAVRIDSQDRAFNFSYVIQWLCTHLETNIFIWESGKTPIAKELLRRINPHKTKITYWFEQTNDTSFHRTRLLNEALIEVKTPVCCNYDCDILLEPHVYAEARDKVLSGVPFVYPYFIGLSQKQIFRTTLKSNLLEEPKHVINQSICGHCFFADTKSYIEAGMECEEMISYAPEDSERFHRFKTLGYKVEHLGNYVYHIEHSRGINSGRTNPHFDAAELKYKQLTSLKPDELRAHYNVAPYLKKYRPRMITLLTYADEHYSKQQATLVARAKELQTVDCTIEADRKRITDSDFYKNNQKLLDWKRGSGYWAWKPHLILETLINMPEDDILIYLDSGDWISSNFRQFLIRKMRTHNMLLTEGSYPCSAYTKRDVFATIGCDEEKYWDALQVEAGIIVCKKNDVTIHIIKEWLRWCLTPGLVTDEQSQTKNLPDFIDHRHDQSILSILRVFHQIETTNEMRKYINCNQQPKE